MNQMKSHAIMMALYLVVIAMGAVMMQRHPIMGIIQILVGTGFFGLRLHWILSNVPKDTP